VDWEEEMKRLLLILAAGLLIASITAPALAWEFALNGEFEWRYRYFARTGGADLFGAPNLAVGTASGATIGFAGPVNNVVRVQGFSAKGSDASIGDERIWFYPEIRINPAVRMRGEYWVTGTNLRGLYDGAGVATAFPANSFQLPQGYSGWFIQNDGTNGNRVQPSGMSIGMWEKFWVTAQLPWGILAVGRRPFPFGFGWSAAHEKDADSESLFLGVPYGPLTLGLFTHSRVVGGDFYVENAAASQLAVGATGAVTPNNAVWATGTDKNRARQDFGGFFTYRNGNVDLGMFQQHVMYKDAHTGAGAVGAASVPAGPALSDDFSGAALPALFIGGAGAIEGDVWFILAINYFKYNNGRFFFNAEYDYEYGEVRRNGGRPLNIYGEAWMLEAGAICGPSKVSVAAFRSSGADRRQGIAFGTAATGGGAAGGAYDWRLDFIPFSGREQTLLPYVWLLGIYGGGNNSYDNRGKPAWADLFAYAARVDYAVAANLNLYGTFMYANRDSNTATALASFTGTALAGAGRPVPAPAKAANVPDTYLGWEADVGLSWKLLEGLTFNARGAWWQPGNWFKYAYVDYTNLNTVLISGSAWPIDPNRKIDPIIGFEGSLLVEF